MLQLHEYNFPFLFQNHILQTKLFTYQEAKLVAMFIIRNGVNNLQNVQKYLPRKSMQEIQEFINDCLFVRSYEPNILNLFDLVHRAMQDNISINTRVAMVKCIKYFSEKQTQVAYNQVQEIFF
ncbi:Hypothetical_protein [Hexamita inflata]|uniref:Hypothetical_protein n=1 Tax=Hexamita inflata TaxID=28002 RepID=A0ABP1GIW1_9EUKA